MLFECYDLTKIHIPDSVTWIGGSAFSFCEGITTLTIPSKVTFIGGNLVYGCDNLQEIIFENPQGWESESPMPGIYFSMPEEAAEYLKNKYYGDYSFTRGA